MITTSDFVLIQKKNLAIFWFWVDSKRNMIAILDCLSVSMHSVGLFNETLKNRTFCWLGWVTSRQSKLLVRTWNLYWVSEGVCCCFLVMLVYSEASFASKWIAYCSYVFTAICYENYQCYLSHSLFLESLKYYKHLFMIPLPPSFESVNMWLIRLLV